MNELMKSKLLFEIPSDITHQEKCIFKKALLESIDFKNALMDLKKSITCLNCKGILNEPKRLKCDHAFCHNCVIMILYIISIKRI